MLLRPRVDSVTYRLRLQRFVFALCSIGAHVIAVGAAMQLGVSSSSRKDPQPAVDFRATAYFIEQRSVGFDELTTGPDAQVVASLSVNVEDAPPIHLRMPELPELLAVFADTFEEASSVTNAADAEEIQRLQKLYVGQINARVARISEMRATNGSVDDTQGHCVVHVVQSDRGEVVDIDLRDCEGNAQRRERVAASLRSASPLPLPPEGLALGSYVTLDASTW